MTQAALDEQFSLDRIQDVDALMARRAEAARDARSQFKMLPAIAYGPHEDHRLNIFAAQAGDGKAPVQVFIHGGFWRSLDADLFSFLAKGFVPFGATLVVLDYPLMPGVRMRDVVDACQMGMNWISANIGNYDGDADQIFVSGNSAGGQLVVELMDGAGDRIKGGTALSGVFDLEPVSRSFQNDSLQLTPDEISRYSPLRRSLDIGAPLLVAVGGRETETFIDQSVRLAEQVGTEALIVPETDHITIVLDALADPDAALNQQVRRQMGLLQ